LERELKVPEVAEGEAIETSLALRYCCVPELTSLGQPGSRFVRAWCFSWRVSAWAAVVR